MEAVSRIKWTLVAGERVIPKDEVLRIIKNHPGLYAGAFRTIVLTLSHSLSLLSGLSGSGNTL